MNKVTLIGRLGNDPEVKQFQDGTTVVRLSVATTERYTNKQGEKVELTEWHTVKFWRKTAEIVAKYFKKGDPIVVEGKLHYDSYEKDGRKVYTTEIQGQGFEFVPKHSGGSVSEPEPEPVAEGEDSDLPF